jgi:drug/metabolite transporter (DMT)-like permease
MHTAQIRTDSVGLLSMLAAVFFFSLMDACMKQLAGTYPPMQVTFLRGAAGLPFVLAMSVAGGDWRALIPVRLRLHVLRGVLAVLTLWLFVYAIRVLSLGDAYSIFLTAPLMVTALSALLLHERVGWRRWSAICVGLAGALIVLRPGGAGVFSLGGLAALSAAAMYALGVILIRVAARTDTAAATVFWTLLVLTALSGALSAPQWTPLQQEHAWWVLLVGATGAAGQWLLTAAFRRTQASVLAPLEYSALLWGVTLDWLLWQALPGYRMLLGSAIVVASGLYIIVRERRLAR